MASKVVVCGGTGFLGRAACKAAAWRGAEVVSLSIQGIYPYTGLDRDQWRLRWNFADYVEWRSCDFTKKDENNLFNDELLQEMEGSDAFIHVIGTKKGDKRRPHKSLQMVNVECLKNSMDLARRVGAPNFVYTSAVDAPYLADGDFMESKRQAELELLKENEKADDDPTKLNVRYLRPGFMYGRENFVTYPLGLALSHGVFSSIRRSRPFWDALSVEDVGRACYHLVSLAHNPNVGNLGNPHDIREFLKEWVEE